MKKVLKLTIANLFALAIIVLCGTSCTNGTQNPLMIDSAAVAAAYNKTKEVWVPQKAYFKSKSDTSSTKGVGLANYFPYANDTETLHRLHWALRSIESFQAKNNSIYTDYDVNGKSQPLISYFIPLSSIKSLINTSNCSGIRLYFAESDSVEVKSGIFERINTTQKAKNAYTHFIFPTIYDAKTEEQIDYVNNGFVEQIDPCPSNTKKICPSTTIQTLLKLKIDTIEQKLGIK